MIPKKDILDIFEDIRTISLCNVVYKIISKIITKRLKPMISPNIIGEKIGFLDGR